MKDNIINIKDGIDSRKNNADKAYINDPSILDTPEPESYDDFEQYRFLKSLKEADGNASGAERQINEAEYYKSLQGEPDTDIERAECHHRFMNAVIGEMKKEFKTRGM